MKIRTLAVLLAVALLVSLVPAVGATETASEPDFSYSLTLNESIAINFKVASEDVEGFEYMEFTKNGSSVKVTEYATVSGKAVFTFDDLTPSELGTTVTAVLCINGQTYTKEASVLSY